MTSEFWRPLAAAGLLVALIVTMGCRSTSSGRHGAASTPPNIVLIFCDDLAYADIGPFGAKTPTPNLDRLAREGMRFTDFYVGQAVCSASRAALMTGCYPNRVGIQGALPPRSKTGLGSNEVTIAQILKGRGYATAIYGKWHLGDAPQFLPTRHGFDEWFGLPYSNDMWPHHPTAGTNYPPLPLYENETVVQLMPDQTQLTTWYTEHAVNFIDRNKDRPFFLYVPHNMPHVPLHVSSKFKGKSGRGLYSDVVMEIDWSVGEILAALKRNGLDEKTLVIFTSDNGPWLLYGDHAGNAGPLREGKATSFDGGVREPCVMRWPGRIPAGVTTREMTWSMDLLPTFARLAGTNAPADRIIDGRDISPLMFGQRNARSPHDAFFVYWGPQLQAVRSGRWKLHLPHDYTFPNPAGHGGRPGTYSKARIGLALFDLTSDVGEKNDVSSEHPDVVARLQALAETCRADLGDSRTKQKGTGVRQPGRL
jgi:arylsulfatase A